jgi:glycosyltransferase involved in cell wall biosynthesis
MTSISKKTCSIIIPDTNSWLMNDILYNLRRQTVDLSQAEVLVVGTDEPGLVTEDELVRFIPTDASRSHASDKRNLGMREARGDLFLFLDDDCIPALDWVEFHLWRHEAGEKVVGGAVTFGTDNYLQLTDNVSAFHDLLPFTASGYRTYLCTSNLSVRREVVDRVGNMMAHKSRAEDLEWTVRFRKAGYRLYFESQALIFHDPARKTPRNVWQHWIQDAPDTLRVRLKYSTLLGTPTLARYRFLFLIAAPLIAAWATGRTFAQLTTLRQYGYTLPLVYLTKLIWCLGAFCHFPTDA